MIAHQKAKININFFMTAPPKKVLPAVKIKYHKMENILLTQMENNGNIKSS